MNWKEAAREDLKNYAAMELSIKTTAERIAALEDQMLSIKGATTDSTPVQGGENRYEDRLLNCMVEKERLSMMRKANLRRVHAIRTGLDSLSDLQRQVLDLFYIHHEDDHLLLLMRATGYAEAQIYRIKNEALYRFTIAEYGLPEY